MKLAIATRCDSNITEMTSMTHPIMKAYAAACGADFIELTEDSDCNVGHGRYHYKIMQVGDLLEKYDRVLNLDSDILINHNCPNLFDVVPVNCIGGIYEDKGSRESDRHERIKKIQNKFGDIGWTEGYPNTGVFMASKEHKNIFEKINGKYWTETGFDDAHLGYQIIKNNHCFYELSFQHNNLSMFSEEWNGYPDRFESFIIHYAGAGIFEGGVYSRLEQIKKDKDRLGL
jgi:hypothetical protein